MSMIALRSAFCSVRRNLLPLYMLPIFGTEGNVCEGGTAEGGAMPRIGNRGEKKIQRKVRKWWYMGVDWSRGKKFAANESLLDTSESIVVSMPEIGGAGR